jgi:RNA polymerase sigma factor (TIGR02999 family)
MTEVTSILSQIEDGDPSAAEKLLPLVYDELRQLAAAKMAQEPGDHTLQATALVHEAYLRLVDVNQLQRWDSRRHFFAAAAEAMRRVLIENARRKSRQKHGGSRRQIELNEDQWVTTASPEQLLSIDESLRALSAEDPLAAEVLKLRYFVGMSIDEAAELMELHRATVYRHWSYARAWIRAELLAND